MAEIWGAAIGAGAGILGGIMGGNAASKAAKAQEQANQQAIAEQQREFNQTQQNIQPYLGAGQNAVNLETAYLNGDTSGFANSPDYQFAVQQGTKQLDAGAAAKGNLWGGGADADRIALGQGLATQYANNYWNKISGVANQGAQAATNLGQLGQSNANAIGGYLQNSGQAAASGIAGQQNAWNNALNQIANAAGQYYANNPTGTSYNLGNNLGSYWNGNGLNTGTYGSYNFANMSGGG